MPIKSFKIDAESALRLIRKIAKNSSNIVIPDPPNAQTWEKTVNYRQVILCLKEGNVIDQPNIDSFGNFECQLERLSAGTHVKVTVVMMKNNNARMLIVRRVEKQP